MAKTEPQLLSFVYNECRDQPQQALFVPVLSLTQEVQPGDLFIATNCRDAKLGIPVLQTLKQVTPEGRLVGLMNVEPYCCLVPAGKLPQRPAPAAIVPLVMPPQQSGFGLQLTADITHDPKSGFYTARFLEFPQPIGVGRSTETAIKELFDALNSLFMLRREELSEPDTTSPHRIVFDFIMSSQTGSQALLLEKK